MPALRRFRLGGVTYPLVASTANELIVDADPALYHAIRLFTFALKRHVGPRLLLEAKKVDGLKLPSAVESAIAEQPSPFVLAADIVFPIFCLYRVEDEWSQINASHIKSISTWEWAYVLPPLTPAGIKAIQPILRSVAATMAAYAFASFDPAFESGKTLRTLSGISNIKPGPTRYGDYEKLQIQGEAAKWWRAVTGQLIVEERDELVVEDADDFEGVDVSIGLAATNVETLEDFVQVRTDPAPTIATIGPIEGTHAGGTPFEIYGTNFVPGARMCVVIGGAFADSVVVVHPTKLVGCTPVGVATISGAGVDVQVIGADGQLSNVLTGAYRFL